MFGFEGDRDVFADIGDCAGVSFAWVEVEEGIIGGKETYGFCELLSGHFGLLEAGDVGTEVLETCFPVGEPVPWLVAFERPQTVDVPYRNTHTGGDARSEGRSCFTFL